MRVVLAAHNTAQWLGVNKYFYLLAGHLADLGVNVRVIVDAVEGLDAVHSVCGTRHVSTRLLKPTATGGPSTARYCWNLNKYLLAEVDFDVLHCGHILPFFYLMNEERKPVVFQPFGNELFTLAGRGLNRWYCKAAQPVLRFCGERADMLLAEGDFQRMEMRKYYPKYFCGKDLGMLPVGVDTRGALRKTEYTPHGPFQFLAVNSLLPYEGMDELVAAFRKVYKRCYSRLVIVGAGSEKARLEELATGTDVLFLEDVPEPLLRTLYADSDAFVCTTRETDFQMGVLEAMASGLPVLAREAEWLPGSVGWFQKDGSDLADKMFSLAAKPVSSKAEEGKRCLGEVQQYSFTRIAEKAVKIYEEVVG